MPATPEFQQRLESIEQLIRQIEAAADPNLRSAARELVQLVMELHGAGLERMLEILRATDAGQSMVDNMGRDGMVSSLLVLYGLHPLSFEDRVKQAIEKANLRMPSGASAELSSIEGGAVRVHLKANGNALVLNDVVEAALYQSAPDVESLTIEGGEDKQGFVPLEVLLGVPPVRPAVNGHSLDNPGIVRH